MITMAWWWLPIIVSCFQTVVMFVFFHVVILKRSKSKKSDYKLVRDFLMILGLSIIWPLTLWWMVEIIAGAKKSENT
jgi:hypothetical protein